MTDATETLTIVAFIEARLREDEETARAAMTWDDTTRWVADHQGVFEVADGIGRDDELIASTGVQHVSDGLEYERATHIARHDPARVLREVARNRRVLERHRKFVPSDGVLLIGIAGSGDICAGCGMSNGHRAWPCAEVRDLASIWSDHPDFRAEWSA